MLKRVYAVIWKLHTTTKSMVYLTQQKEKNRKYANIKIYLEQVNLMFRAQSFNQFHVQRFVTICSKNTEKRLSFIKAFCSFVKTSGQFSVGKRSFQHLLKSRVDVHFSAAGGCFTLK